MTAGYEISKKKNAWQLNLLLYIQLRACFVQDYKQTVDVQGKKNGILETKVQWLDMANAITTALEELMLYSTLDKTNCKQQNVEFVTD